MPLQNNDWASEITYNKIIIPELMPDEQNEGQRQHFIDFLQSSVTGSSSIQRSLQ